MNWKMLAGAGPLPTSALASSTAQQKTFGVDLLKPMLYEFQKFYFGIALGWSREWKGLQWVQDP